ncbi:MAG: 7-carboxy-7-deazaguanine synthase [Aquisalimonadaceae bacterium]
MTYTVKDLFHTLQGEGMQTGRSAVFLRFAGCNLWSGREEHRETAVCRFCDTEFVGGDKHAQAESLASAARACWDAAVADKASVPYVVCTGGEPLLQLDAPLIDALHRQGFEVAVETNGTLRAPPGLDWVCVSPKAGAELRQVTGDELKVVWPQPELDLEALAKLEFAHFLLQPMDGHPGSTQACVNWCRAHPRWRLSLQTHKILEIP